MAAMSSATVVLHVEEEVGIFPNGQRGCILVLGRHGVPETLCWVPRTEGRLWLVGQPGGVPEAATGSLVLDLARDVESVTHVSAADTLLIHGRDGQTRLFHPVSDDSIASLLLLRPTPTGDGRRDDDARHPPDVSPVFEAFSKVTKFYLGAAQWVLGGQHQRRPRREPTEGTIVHNPWIISRVRIMAESPPLLTLLSSSSCASATLAIGPSPHPTDGHSQTHPRRMSFGDFLPAPLLLGLQG